MHPAVPEWLGPLWHSSNELAMPDRLKPLWHSNIAYMAMPEWLKPLWHSNIVGMQCQNGLSHSSTHVMPLAVIEWVYSTHGNATVRFRMARATLHGT